MNVAHLNALIQKILLDQKLNLILKKLAIENHQYTFNELKS